MDDSVAASRSSTSTFASSAATPPPTSAMINVARAELKPIMFEGARWLSTSPLVAAHHHHHQCQDFIGSSASSSWTSAASNPSTLAIPILSETITSVDLTAHPFHICSFATVVKANALIITTNVVACRVHLSGMD
ncbi:putative Thioredoxin reductase NTRB [Cocos nucifera]|uniref:Putative Thioredoxin reductase NTRB n=1 Tax=Cocos nucifera TaxID=13894 RepID=A0A8K0IPC3_COCNU|nr:putative Thioredoxin reductase NTRB [Cocos nucifera]